MRPVRNCQSFDNLESKIIDELVKMLHEALTTDAEVTIGLGAMSI